MSLSSRAKACICFGIAIAATGLAMTQIGAVADYYQDEMNAALAPETKVAVIVASRDLYPGIPIASEDLSSVQIAPRYLPEGAFLRADHLIGRIPHERILANEAVRSDRLTDFEAGTGLSAVIPRGMRAMSINLDNGPALAGLLRPGSYVDMISHTIDSGGAVTDTMLEGIYVIGVNSLMSGEATEVRSKRGQPRATVTLLVDPDQQQQVAAAQYGSQVTLTLRPDGDRDIVGPPGIRPFIEQVRQASAPLVPLDTAAYHDLLICRGARCETERFDGDADTEAG